MIWLDPVSPAVRTAVVSGVWGKEPHSEHSYPIPTDPDEIDTITAALQVASDILTPLSAYRIHPAGIADEDFQVSPRAHRLTPNYAPIRRVLSVQHIGADGLWDDVTESWILAGNSLRFQNSGVPWVSLFCRDDVDGDRIRVSYQFGSTITASARRAVLWLAHQFWLESSGCEECGECQLPGRTTSVQREGISFTLLDPQDYLQQGRTGVPSVDLWLASTNPRRALRPAGVYSPDSPPPENVRIKSVRPVWLAGTP
jgi:hypothetical protein